MSASLWCHGVIAVAPSIRGSDEPSPLTVTEGNPITLVCDSSGIPPPSLVWRKDGEHADHQTGSSGLQHVTIIPKQPCSHLSGSELKPDQRLRVLSGGRQLQISSAARTDTASYSCTASSASGVTSKEYSLQVYGTLEPPYLYHLILKFIYFTIWLFTYPLQLAPSLVFLISVRPSIKHSTGVTDDVAVTKGGNVTLQCAAEGIPRPAVTWLKDGRPLSGHHRAKILNEGRLLQIRNVKVSDTGRYTCTAVNVAGQADSRHDISVHGMYCVFIFIVVIIIIILHFVLSYLCPSFLLWPVPPIITGQVEAPENVSVVVKNPIALRCEASGIPLPAISWLKDGHPVKVSSSVHVLSGDSCLTLLSFFCMTSS